MIRLVDDKQRAKKKTKKYKKQLSGRLQSQRTLQTTQCSFLMTQFVHSIVQNYQDKTLAHGSQGETSKKGIRGTA